MPDPGQVHPDQVLLQLRIHNASLLLQMTTDQMRFGAATRRAAAEPSSTASAPVHVPSVGPPVLPFRSPAFDRRQNVRSDSSLQILSLAVPAPAGRAHLSQP